MGVWLPLALADVFAMLVVVSRRACGDTGEIKAPSRGEVLRSWMLPAMAAAVAEDDEERKAVELLRSIERLKNEQKRSPV